jgi:transcriptional regulator with GAF, ATPase, and Fis domain
MGLLVGAHFYFQKRERVTWLLAGPPPFPTAEDHGVIFKDAARISGETGVGKEVLVRQLYSGSNRCKKTFVKVNCAALPDTLLESEMFGYERGAFTGAQRRTKGKFEQADGGVLFLGEIGGMSLPLQSKLLHALQDGRF